MPVGFEEARSKAAQPGGLALRGFREAFLGILADISGPILRPLETHWFYFAYFGQR